MDDKPKDWGDFAAAKAVRFEVALEALGVTLRRDGEQLQGVCPLHTSTSGKETLGVHLGKQTFNCFACKKHGKVLDFVMQFKQIGAKEAATWLLSLVNNREVQESVQAEGSRNGAGVQLPEVQATTALGAEPAAMSGNGKPQLTERELWLLGLMAHATAFAFARLFEPLRDTETVERTIMAMVEIHGGVYVQSRDKTGVDRQVVQGTETAAHSNDEAGQPHP
jgi:hypothetical protein